ncbi:VOC family protein [Dactylosporangium salmoneum]
MTTSFTLTFDCAAPGRMAAFWCEALGYVPAGPPAGFDSWEQWLRAFAVPEEEWDDGAAIEDPSGTGPRISFLKVPEPKTAKNRVHLDVQAGGGRAVPWETRWPRVRATADRLIAAGATVLTEAELDGHLDHIVLADPEGNEFCVV